VKQVNMLIPDDLHEVLVKECAKKQLATGKVVRVASMASSLICPILESLKNGHNPMPISEDSKPVENPYADMVDILEGRKK